MSDPILNRRQFVAAASLTAVRPDRILGANGRIAGRGPAPHQQLAGVVGQVPDLPWHFSHLLSLWDKL